MSLTPWAEQRERAKQHTLGQKTNRQLSLGEALTLGCVAYRLRFSGGCATGSFEASGMGAKVGGRGKSKDDWEDWYFAGDEKKGVNCL
jgi:hypothetical protein